MAPHKVKLNLSKLQIDKIRKNRGSTIRIKPSNVDSGRLVNINDDDFHKLIRKIQEGKGANLYVSSFAQEGDGVVAEVVKARIPDTGVKVIDKGVDKAVDYAEDEIYKKGKKVVKKVAKKTWKGIKKLFGRGVDGEPIYIEVDEDGRFEITGEGIRLAGEGIKLAGEGIRLAGEKN